MFQAMKENQYIVTGSRGSFVNSETTIQDGISRANSRAFSNGSGSAFASSIVGKDGKASADADVKNKPGSKPLECVLQSAHNLLSFVNFSMLSFQNLLSVR